jgi:hypothetical protein
VWKWLHLADKAGLTACLPDIAKRTAQVDRAGCTSFGNLRGLSQGVLLQMVAALAVLAPAAPAAPAASVPTSTGFGAFGGFAAAR